MKKLLLLTKTLLAAALLCVGQNAWGQTVTWNMDAQGTYTGGKELSSNTSIVSVKLGSGTWSYDATWGVCGSPNNEQPTLTDNVPTSGNYIVIKPTVDITMSLDTRSSTNHNFVLIEESNPTTEIINVRARYYITYELGTLSKSLKAGKTYYAYSKGGANLGYRAFTVKTIEEYSIHYVDNSATPVTIKPDVVHEGVYGTSVSASGSDLDAIVYNEKTYAYSSGNTPITLTTGTNKITLVYELAGEHNYTVNAVAGSSTLKELATGSAVESMEYSVSNLPLVIEKDGNYYALTDAGVSGYTKTFTMGTSDEVKTVEYTLDESIAYFAEGEVLYSDQLTASADCSNGAYTYYLSGLTSTFPLSAGWYRMETVVKDRANKNPLNIYLEDGTQLGTIAKGGSTGFRQTDMFKIDATSNVKIGLTDPSNKNSLSFDYVLVRSLPIPLTVSATITSAGYATFSSTYALDFSEVSGLTAYIATSGDASTVTIEPVEDAAAGTGLVLKGAAGTYNIPVIASGTDRSGSNKLWAITEDGNVTKATDANYTNYVLALQEGSVVFAPVTGENYAPVKAGQAALCLQTSGLARALSISFGDITAVENVEAAPTEAKAKEGKFIENGKLVIVKNGVKYNAAGAQVK